LEGEQPTVFVFVPAAFLHQNGHGTQPALSFAEVVQRIGLSMPQMLFSVNQCADPRSHWYQSRPPANYWTEYEEVIQGAGYFVLISYHCHYLVETYRPLADPFHHFI